MTRKKNTTPELPEVSVSDDGEVRHLHLGTPWIQGSMRVDDPFALELEYRRAFDGPAIAKRSLDEMQGIAPLEPARSRQWLDLMARTFPDVAPGDRLLGQHDPDRGARFYLNGRLHGTVDDPVFSARFFGIWLSPRTSQPRMRETLLQSVAGASPRTP